jgi:hypothetical protein
VSDVVFGFALTLLVVVSFPSYSDLIAGMRSFSAFAHTFATLTSVWRGTTGASATRDCTTTPPVLNTLIRFVVLFYVYPLNLLLNVCLPRSPELPWRSRM